MKLILANRSENAVNFLTSWGCEINKPDKEGNYTPLHLAVISSNAKIVRRLLQKGADRNMIDKNFKKPIDIAKENDFHNIYSMLEVKNKYCELCEIKNKNKFKSKNVMGLSMFFFVIFAFHVTTILLYFPCLNLMKRIL